MKRLLVLTLLLTGCGGGVRNAARVERVVDGDTIVVRVDGRSERVRYIGVDTPESVKPGVRVQCFAKSAAKENAKLVLGRDVRLEYDAEARDRYGRLLAYVWRGDLLVNAELVRLGYGKPLEIAPNLAHAAELRQLAAAAKRDHRGLWSRC
ncbi:thermonuclease family protein [Solirubrobacter ginsenosidimutans]|uniref:Thermonuclease family protein n=1 Tax=Solirubrobacter ginsenosidimutans TaxID=490573 RepID=A0A9X3S1H0_9ACTN|nr:thermonuclease family protein [Solirubrobacter ginsenosidimutans]MDA0163380.1 thermonuclease family protein [Solirubrobacter ginsenosidimutans]